MEKKEEQLWLQTNDVDGGGCLERLL